MRSKKLILNVLSILSAVMMTTVMVLSSCSNSANSEYAEVTINMGGSSSGRAISAEEKSTATFNVYFNDSLVASNVKGTYNGTAQVGTRLNIRLDAILNGKRIARGENTITVRSPSNDVDVTLYENREQSSGELKGTPQIGSIIMKDGSYLPKEQITSENKADAIAVVYKVDAENKKMWAVGKVHDTNAPAWCDRNAKGYNITFTELTTNVSGSAGDLTFTGYLDGSTGWQKLKAGLGSNDDTNQEGNYPAWEWINNYARSQDMTGELASGWYFPSEKELYEILQQKNTVDASLSAIGGNEFGSNFYWSSSQFISDPTTILTIDFGGGNWNYGYKYETYCYVCAVRQFTF